MRGGTGRLIVVTGGPGSGKSTLLAALAEAGVATVPEVGRRIIREQTVIQGRALPSVDPALFAETMLSWEMRAYHDARDREGPVVFDRGVPDVMGYLRLSGLPVPPHVMRAAALCRYNREVFIAPHWPDIYTGDRERRQSEDEALRTYESMVATYRDCGYALVELPLAPVGERVRFVLERLGLSR
ncbi:AAA family ATPase [Marinivivus vitaminiproducens]|uniref:AAA family ATPase n=1 Tax=Marinivivus vitaminiproducens TaxID=3035935 RepID=UPI002798849D|nr:AAA family ATPase [Geminicoccaceae bacterium SCSIO 64248]